MKKRRHATQPTKRNNRKKAARPATAKVRRRAHQRPTQKPSGNSQYVAVLQIIAQLIIAVLSFTAHYTKANAPAAAPIANWHIVSTSASMHYKTPPRGGLFRADDATGVTGKGIVSSMRAPTQEQG